MTNEMKNAALAIIATHDILTLEKLGIVTFFGDEIQHDEDIKWVK